MVSTATRPVLTDSKTLSEVVNCLTEHIPIKTQGKCEQQNINESMPAIKAVQQQNTLVAIITYLLALIEPLKLKIERLYLDREFFCVPVIRWLQALDIPFEMPVIIR